MFFARGNHQNPYQRAAEYCQSLFPSGLELPAHVVLVDHLEGQGSDEEML